MRMHMRNGSMLRAGLAAFTLLRCASANLTWTSSFVRSSHGDCYRALSNGSKIIV